jgi:DNA ligase-1
MKPHLLDDWQPDKLVFPMIGQPKVDGVRALNLTGKLTARSLKPFKNRYLTSRFSHSALIGFDGEMAAERETHPDLCRMTTSATGTILGEPYVLWWLFDYVTVENRNAGYEHRMLQLTERVRQIAGEAPHLFPHLRIMPSRVLHSLEELEAYDEENLIAGYEGTVLCGADMPHKDGRAGKKLFKWRIKRFVDFEFKVHTIIEGEENQNAAQVNELGNTFRSSHQENMVANGMVGAMLGTVLADVKDGDTLLFPKGAEVRVGAGCLTHDQRRHYFINQNEFMSLIHKAKFFPKGIKDKPRFPTWQSFRNAEDM